MNFALSPGVILNGRYRIEQEIAAIGGDHHFVNGVCTRCGASQYENTNTAASSAGQADTGSSGDDAPFAAPAAGLIILVIAVVAGLFVLAAYLTYRQEKKEDDITGY